MPNLINRIQNNIDSIIHESVELPEHTIDSEILEICDYFNIESLNGLSYDMIEELTQSQLEKHKDTSRGGLNARRIGRLAVTSVIPFGILVTQLSEVGIIPTTEKHAFIRFQGLISIHAKRVDVNLGGSRYENEVKKIRDSVKLPKNSPPQKVAKVYSETTAHLLALVVSGYYKIMVNAKADPAQLDTIKNNLLHIGDTAVKGIGVWNRIKSGASSAFATMAFRPLISLTKQFSILDSKAPSLKMKGLAQAKFKQMIK